MMKKLILGMAAGALLLSTGAIAKEKAGKGKAGKAMKGPGKIEDCDDKAKAAAEAIEKAEADLKASAHSGKAAGHFAKAQNGLKHSLAEIKKGCSAAAAKAAAGGADAKQGGDAKQEGAAEQKKAE